MDLRHLINPGTDKLQGKELQSFRRDELGLSQKGLADCLGVSVRTVQGWEIGKSKPMTPIVRLIRLFKFIPAVRRLFCPVTASADAKTV
jgi:DNA-binding transcriptional regulator YiaG